MNERRPRSPAALVLIGLAAVLAFGLLVGLGTWQLQRRVWKLALIERVNERVHAAPTPPPGPEEWRLVTTERDEYRHVRIAGVFAGGRDTLVQAVTQLGAGFWVMTPLRTDAGFTVLVNRGFAASEDGAQPSPPPAVPPGEIQITGLLRISEPHGGFLHANDPTAGRWYSRDVAAIASARGLGAVAPYFIDADASSSPSGGPVGGLTVIRFPNSHLIYAIIWFGLALMTVGGLTLLVRDDARLRRALAARRRMGSDGSPDPKRRAPDGGDGDAAGG